MFTRQSSIKCSYLRQYNWLERQPLVYIEQAIKVTIHPMMLIDTLVKLHTITMSHIKQYQLNRSSSIYLSVFFVQLKRKKAERVPTQ